MASLLQIVRAGLVVTAICLTATGCDQNGSRGATKVADPYIAAIDALRPGYQVAFDRYLFARNELDGDAGDAAGLQSKLSVFHSELKAFEDFLLKMDRSGTPPAFSMEVINLQESIRSSRIAIENAVDANSRLLRLTGFLDGPARERARTDLTSSVAEYKRLTEMNDRDMRAVSLAASNNGSGGWPYAVRK